jgi:histidinol-phosphate aminotransferase
MQGIKDRFLSMTRYPYEVVHASIKLDQNESPFDLPAEIKERALSRLADSAWNRYPDMNGREVKHAIAHYTDWPEDGVALAPGSNFLIHALTHIARRVVDTEPSFAYYKQGALLAGVDYQTIRLGPQFDLPVEELLTAVTDPPGVLFLANPHAPTGSLFREADVLRVVDAATQNGWLVVIDEAYYQFSGSDYRAAARANASVVLLRTFSKAWCLGGIRAGYALGSPQAITAIQSALPPFLFPVHSTAVISAALESPAYVQHIAKQLVAERERVRAALAPHPLWKTYPSATNFLLIRTPDAEAAYRQLLARGILVRRQDHYRSLPGCIRVSIGRPEENDAFIEAAYAEVKR